MFLSSLCFPHFGHSRRVSRSSKRSCGRYSVGSSICLKWPASLNVLTAESAEERREVEEYETRPGVGAVEWFRVSRLVGRLNGSWVSGLRDMSNFINPSGNLNPSGSWVS